MHVSIEGLDEFLKQEVAAAVKAALAARNDDPWLTAPETAARLGIAVATIYDYVQDEKLERHGEPGSKLRFRRSAIDAFAEGRR